MSRVRVQGVATSRTGHCGNPLAFFDAAGAKTGSMFPIGNLIDVVCGVPMSLVEGPVAYVVRTARRLFEGSADSPKRHLRTAVSGSPTLSPRSKKRYGTGTGPYRGPLSLW